MGHRLAITKVWFNKSGAPEDVVPLGNLDGTGLTAKSLFEAHFDDLFWEAPSSDHKIRFRAWAPSSGTDLVGAIFMAGEGGIEADLYDEALENQVGSRTAEMYEAPLVLALAYLPNTADVGWLVTHAFYNRYFKAGLLQSLHGAVGSRVRAIEPKLKLNLESWAPVADLRQIIDDGQVTGFSVQDPVDVDAFTPGGMLATEVGKIRLVVVPDRGHKFTKKPFLDAVDDGTKRLEHLTVDEKAWSEGIVDVQTATGTRKFVLGSDNKEWFSWDVTEQVGTGQPEAQALVDAALDLLSKTGRRPQS